MAFIWDQLGYIWHLSLFLLLLDMRSGVKGGLIWAEIPHLMEI